MVEKFMIRQKETCRFCSVIGYITTGCPTKVNIGRSINLIVLLKHKYCFRPIEKDEVSNIYRSQIDQPKIKHICCQQLLLSTKPCLNKRPKIENLIVKATFFDNVGNTIIGFCNTMIELKLIIGYIDNKI